MSVADTESKNQTDKVLQALTNLVEGVCKDCNLSLRSQVHIEQAMDNLVAWLTYAMLYEREGDAE